MDENAARLLRIAHALGVAAFEWQDDKTPRPMILKAVREISNELQIAMAVMKRD